MGSAGVTDRAYLVTGGATGIGAAITSTLVAGGGRVAVVQRTDDELQAALDSSSLRGRVVGLHGDVSDPDDCRRIVTAAVEGFGRLDGLVNNAAVTGPPAHRALLDVDDTYIDQMIDVNVKGAVRCSVAAGRHMARAGGGVIVNITSVLAYAPAPSAALYSATKAALLGFTRGAALELGPAGVRVVCVSPGDIDTASSIAPPAAPGQRPVRTPALARRGVPGEIGDVVAFLLSDASAYITGTDVVVDGGFLLG